jgi:hypothetical protein
VRIQAPDSSYTPQSAASGSITDNNVIGSPMAAAGTQTIVTSTGQNDAGLFDVNLHDERWLPFEGQGAISAWNLVLDPRDNNFDFTTITDVVFHVRYTARGGGDLTAANTVRTALAKVNPPNPGSILISVRNTFGDNYYTFFNPPNSAAGVQTLTLPLSPGVFPYSNLGSVSIQSVTFYVLLSAGVAANDISASFNPASAPVLALNVSSLSTAAGSAVNALTASTTFNPLLPPQSFVLTVPAVGGQNALPAASVEDILLVVNYSIG